MSPNKQVRVVKALNRLAKQFRGMVHKREIPRIRHQPRVRQFVRTRDLIELFQKLLSTRKKRAVHLGIDDSQLNLTYNIIIGKTNVPHVICLNTQICSLLQAFN
jgi:Ni,Fe-hydrogenase III component G